MRIHVTPAILRLLGGIFFLVGLLFIALLALGVILGQSIWTTHFWVPLVIGIVFLFVGWAVYADEYLVIDHERRVIRFYEPGFFSPSSVVHELPLGQTPDATIEDYKNTSSKGDAILYRVMLDGHCVRDSLSKKGARRFKGKLESQLRLH